jgi:hypothetical protein
MGRLPNSVTLERIESLQSWSRLLPDKAKSATLELGDYMTIEQRRLDLFKAVNKPAVLIHIMAFSRAIHIQILYGSYLFSILILFAFSY